MSSPITLSGFGTFDASSIVDALIQQASAPITLFQRQQQTIQNKMSAFQVLSRNVLNLRSAADSLVDPTLFGNVSTTSSNSSAISAVGANGAPLGSYNVAVTTLARPSVVLSHSGYASDQAVLGTGSLTINVGSSSNPSITIDSSNDTLAGVRDAINKAGVGVTASVVNRGNGANPFYLVLTSNTSGLSNDVSVSGTLNGSAFTADTTQTPQSASLTVNGVQITSDSNTIAGAIPGVTLTLNQPNSSGTIAVSTSTSQIKSGLQAFVSAYNTLNSFFGQQSTFNPATKSAGILSGDSTLGTVRSSVHSAAIESIASGGLYNTLTDLGVEFQQDGTLTINDSTLTDALTNHLSDVQKFFQGSSANGFANRLQSIATTLTDPLTGILPATTTGLQSTVSNLQTSIDNLQGRFALERQTLSAQFAAAQQAIADLQTQGNSLGGLSSSLLGQLLIILITLRKFILSNRSERR